MTKQNKKIQQDILTLLSCIKSLDTYWEYEFIANMKNRYDDGSPKEFTITVILKDEEESDKISKTLH